MKLMVRSTGDGMEEDWAVDLAVSKLEVEGEVEGREGGGKEGGGGEGVKEREFWMEKG